MSFTQSILINTREKAGLWAGMMGILINGMIFAMELFASIMTGSTTLMADAFHNSIDAVTSVITVVSFFIVTKPADQKHPFGFGRVEYLSSLFIGVMMISIGAFFAHASFLKIVNPEAVQFSTSAFILMIISILLKLFCSYVNRKYAQKVSSQILTAASLDAMGDVLILSVASFSLLLTKLTGMIVDGPIGLLVSSIIIFSGFSVAKRAASSLIGQAPDPQVFKLISEAVLQAKYVVGFHDLIVHDYGPGKIIASVHAEVPADVPWVKVHETLAPTVLDMQTRGVELVIHIDPVAVHPKWGRHKCRQAKWPPIAAFVGRQIQIRSYR